MTGSLQVVRWLLAALLIAAALPACFKSSPRVGSETHFMQLCSSDTCVGDLSCICGVCTQACKGDDACKDLADGASCEAVNADSTACGESKPPARTCDARCGHDADCKTLGADFACMNGGCRQSAKMSATGGGSSMQSTGGGATDATSSECSGSECALADAPLVMLLVDTSGSMERLPDCVCTTPGCSECLPNCATKERNRWTVLLEALTGGYGDDYSCDALDRTPGNGASFDVGYFLPNYEVHGTQRADGLLDAYRDKLRFGLATFDGWDTWIGAPPLVAADDFDDDKSEGVDGLWSYNPERATDDASLRRADGTRIGTFQYPNTTAEYQMDTGIRGPNASQGTLVAAAQHLSPDNPPLTPAEVELTNDSIQRSLLRVTPYGGTPIAAALDDLYYFLDRDPVMEAERASGSRPYVVLITDGYPDDDYRSFGCDCATSEDPSSSDYCGGGGVDDPSKMHCPYPLSEEAARALRCGQGETCGAGPAARVYVVGYAIDDGTVVSRLSDIAAAGGTRAANFSDTDSLRRDVGAILDEILAAH